MQVCLQAITYVPPEEDELVEMYKRWAIAYSACLMCHLRETEDMEAVLKVQIAQSSNNAALLFLNCT